MNMLEKMNRVGVDLDGTLAFYEYDPDEYFPDRIGEPIPHMVDMVKKMLAEGVNVVIFTARLHPEHKEDAAISKRAIEEWCLKVFGRVLEVTCEKDPRMQLFFDDRAISVQNNTGRILTPGYLPGIRVHVKRCSRCGKTHRGLVFSEFENSCDGWTHWSMCPETGEPVLMQVEKDQPDSLGSFIEG